MLNIINPVYYLESITIDSSSAVSIDGRLPAKERVEFRYSVNSRLREHFFNVIKLARIYGSAIKPVDDLVQSWIEVDADQDAPSDTKRYIADIDLHKSPELIEAFVAFDRTGRLTESSMHNWLNRSSEFRSNGQLPEAFRCAGAALARGHAPYLKFRVKDDTGQKRRIAEIMREDGNIEEGFAILTQLAYEWLEVVNLVDAQ